MSDIIARHARICGRETCGHHHMICGGPTRCSFEHCTCWCHRPISLLPPVPTPPEDGTE